MRVQNLRSTTPRGIISPGRGRSGAARLTVGGGDRECSSRLPTHPLGQARALAGLLQIYVLPGFDMAFAWRGGRARVRPYVVTECPLPRLVLPLL